MSKITMTHHAVERKWQRRISQGMIKKTIREPDGKKHEADGDTQFHKIINGRKVHVVAHPQRNGDWLIKTVWVDSEADSNLHQ
ncbi:MAG: DUF4258 domain-containing protein [Chloroflexota bacterium]